MLTEVLKGASKRGEVRIPDCGLAASEFIAMLRGNIYLEAVLELRGPPAAEEIDARVRSVVNSFLHGVQRS